MPKLSGLKPREAQAYRLVRRWAAPDLIPGAATNDAQKWIKFITVHAADALQKRSLEQWQVDLLYDGSQRAGALKTEKDRIRCGLFHILLVLWLPGYLPVLWKALDPLKVKGSLRLTKVRQLLIGLKLVRSSISERTLERLAGRGLIGGAFRPSPKGVWRVRVNPEFCEFVAKQMALSATEAVWEYLQPFLKSHQRLQEISLFLRVKTRVGLHGKMPPVRLCDIDPLLWDTPWDANQLKIFAVVDDLESRGEKVSVKTVAKALGISPATFKRRKLHKVLREQLAASASTEWMRKDPRAKHLYEDQLLQESNNKQP